MPMISLYHRLNKIYDIYTKRDYVHPDPLEFLYAYPDVKDREIAALIASALAYGRVTQILKSVSSVLDRMGKSPYRFLKQNSLSALENQFKGFRHRFADDRNLSALLIGIKNIINEYDSLNHCFINGLNAEDETILSGMKFFCAKLAEFGNPGHLVPLPDRGSACKRMNLFLRWMVRQDEVDPGGWEGISASKLIVPLDVHLHRVSREMGLTQRNQADMRTALEITAEFRKFAPDDPVKYDFALTRPGIRRNNP